jgi:cysteine-rich repeat protein
MNPLYKCNQESPTVCVYTCGDWVIDFDFGEECDDQNTLPNYGYSKLSEKENFDWSSSSHLQPFLLQDRK